MKKVTAIQLALIVTLICTYVVGCFHTPIATGPTPEALADAAGKQKDSTEIIDKEANSILIKSREDHSKSSAGKIKEANVNLKNNVEVLEKEAEAKKSLEEALDQANQRIEKLEAKDNKFTKWACRVAVVAGMFLTAIGLVIFVKSGFTQWEVGALGISLTVTSGVTMWFFANIIWFIVGIGVIALLGVLLWVFLRTDKAAEAGVEVSEMLKKRIKKLQVIESDDMDDDGKYIDYDEVQAIIRDVFGDDTHHGIAGANQSDGVRAYITGKRKKIHKKVKSLYE